MASLNRAVLMGNLGRDPEMRKGVCSFSVATTDTWRDESGEKKEKTEWHKVVVFGKLAELCAKYLVKGRPVLVEGKIQTTDWKDKDGNRRFTTEIVAQNVQFIGGGAPREEVARTEATTGTLEDIPF